ncbi:MAG TPA: ABC transporter ATP-binding protein [Casimicrobiaceae bacterium]|nr:ABC transporter ATP-binding protein [Casimicrobiaceae bacterium]
MSTVLHERTPLAIVACGIAKAYRSPQPGGSLSVLEGVDFTLRVGEFVSIVGPSGCGKTTLLRILAGLVTPGQGSLEVLGRVTDGPGPERAMVFQNFALLPWLDALDNVAFGLELRDVPREERNAIAADYLKLVGLSGFEHAYPRQLSGGMQQRIGLARALAVDPEILLMDEPLGAVDALTRSWLQLDLLRIWDETRKSVVFVTHDVGEAVLLSDRVVVMGTRPGRILEERVIDLPRPRSDATRESARFNELSMQIWRSLKEMVIERPGGGAGRRSYEAHVGVRAS